MPFIPLVFFTSKLCKRSSTSSSLHKRSSGHSPGMQSGMSSSHNAGTVELKHCKKFSFSSVILPDSLGIEDFCLHNLDGPQEHLAVQLQIVEEFSFFSFSVWTPLCFRSSCTLPHALANHCYVHQLHVTGRKRQCSKNIVSDSDTVRFWLRETNKSMCILRSTCGWSCN